LGSGYVLRCLYYVCVVIRYRLRFTRRVYVPVTVSLPRWITVLLPRLVVYRCSGRYVRGSRYWLVLATLPLFLFVAVVTFGCGLLRFVALILPALRLRLFGYGCTFVYVVTFGCYRFCCCLYVYTVLPHHGLHRWLHRHGYQRLLRFTVPVYIRLHFQRCRSLVDVCFTFALSAF
jgi:hypothetical protein